MNLQITNAVLWGMIEAMDETWEQEQCAVLYGKHVPGGVQVLAFEFVMNRHPRPHNAYRIALSDVANRHREKIVGVFHTHLEGHAITASEQDVALLSPDHVGIVYHMPSGTITYFTSQQNKGT